MQVRLRGAGVYALAATVYGTDNRGEPLWPDESTARVMAMWGQALADVAAVRHADDDARLTMRDEASRLEWLLKWQLMERYRRKRPYGRRPGGCGGRALRHGRGRGRRLGRSAAGGALDLAWAGAGPRGTVSLTERLSASMAHLDGREQVARAADEPPRRHPCMAARRAGAGATPNRRWPHRGPG